MNKNEENENKENEGIKETKKSKENEEYIALESSGMNEIQSKYNKQIKNLKIIICILIICISFNNCFLYEYK